MEDSILKLSEDGKTLLEVTDKSVTEVVIPQGVTTIGTCAFSFHHLQRIDIPDSVTVICRAAFFHCSALQSIDIPDSVTTIGQNAFCNCESLTSIEVSENNAHYTSIDGVLFDKHLTTVICYPSNKGDEQYEIPNGITSIENHAFHNCIFLKSINIPDSVTAIGQNAFYICKSLTSIEVSENNAHYTSIDGVLFDKHLTTVICYPSNKGDEQYEIPNGITSIENHAFHNCIFFKSINIPNSVTSIGDWAFADCSSLQSIDIPDGITSIGDNAFFYCDSLTSIEVSENNTHYTSIDGVLFDKHLTTIIRYPSGKGDEQYEIPNGITSIGNTAFFDCICLKSVNIPDSVTTIGQYAFDSCESLTSINIPNSVTSIGDCAFADCSSLQSIDIPNSVTYIAEDAFDYIDFEKCTLYIPSDTRWAYRHHPAFSGFKNIETVRYK